MKSIRKTLYLCYVMAFILALCGESSGAWSMLSAAFVIVAIMDKKRGEEN